MVNTRLRADKDLVVAVTGEEGGGKTALSGGLAACISPVFSWRTHALMQPTESDMRNLITSLPKFEPVIADEAIKILYKLNWQSKGQRFLNMMYAQCRKENKLSILNIPRFVDLNEYFRNQRVKIWIHIVEEISNKKKVGYAVVFVKSKLASAKDPWRLEEMNKQFELYVKKKRLHETDFDLEEWFTFYSHLKNFVGLLRFEWLDSKVWSEYLELKAKVNYDDDQSKDGAEKKEAKDKQRIAALIARLEQAGIKSEEIAATLNVNKSRVTQLKKYIAPA
jgi:hypothetical protein